MMYSIENLNFPAEYFFDEVREGFFVSSMMKRYWADQLKVLSVIDGICKKHDIKWFAYSGTLLGAVRHGGYIPWDDDLDICMLRNDYIRFSKIVHDELPDGYLYLDLQSEPKYQLLLGRVVNSKVIDYGKKHMEEFYGCPYTVGIDVFPLDGMFPDEEKENRRFILECKVMEAAEYIKSGYSENDKCKALLAEIERERGKKFERNSDMMRQLLLLLDELFAQCPIEEAEYITLTPACIKDKKQTHKYRKCWYEVQVQLPFENTYLYAPANYHNVLGVQYGDYMVVRKGGGLHEYPVFKDQEKVLAGGMGHNPFRYTFSMKDLESAKMFKHPNPTSQYAQMIDTMKDVHRQIEKCINQGNEDAAVQLLEGCQNLAVSIGTGIEKVYGEGTEAVKTLEDYCEKVFEFSQGEIENIAELDKAVNTAKENISDLVVGERRKVLFVVSHFEWWRKIEALWYQAKANKALDVTVLVVPYHLKDFSFNETIEVDDSCRFKGIVPFVTEKEYKLTEEQPDIIVIQDPFDGWSTNFTLQSAYYSEKLRKHCRKLVYVPFADVDDPSSEKDATFSAMKYVIEQPGLIYADEVLIRSEKLRELYVDTLVQLSGENNRDYWTGKVLDPANTDWLGGEAPNKPLVRRYVQWDTKYPDPVINFLGEYSKKKIIVYYTSLDYILKNGEKAVDKIQRSLEVMEKVCAEDSVTCVFSPQSAFPALEKLSPGLYEGLDQAVKKFDACEGCFLDSTGIMQEYIEYADAYYGIESYHHKKCMRRGIPVMIENLNI